MKKPEYISDTFLNGYAASNGNKPVGIIIHNDAGAMTPLSYRNWLRAMRTGDNASEGFAHEYISKDYILHVCDFNYGAWAASNTYYNNNYLHFEVCHELNATDEEFIEHENTTFMRVAEVCHEYGINPSVDTFALHTKVTTASTSCPNRSSKMHGGYEQTLLYFIERVRYYMSLGKTMDEMLAALTVEKYDLLGGNSMMFSFHVTGDPAFPSTAIFLCKDGLVTPFEHIDELYMVREMYKKQYGQEMPHEEWTAEAPYYLRYLAPMRRLGSW